MRFRPLPLQFVIAVSAVLALLTGVILHVVFRDWRWHHEPLHSAMEAIGGLCAIVMAIVLFQRNRGQPDRRWEALAVGFLSMGVLEACHAVSGPGHGFILLRSVASFAGGVGFALVWLPESQPHPPTRQWLPWVIATGALTVGLSILAFPERVPEMVRNGEFAPTAVAPTSLASVGFLAASLWFFLDYQRSKTSDAYLFACLALLFGLAELMFTYSFLWDGRWWFWHLLRLLAYLPVLIYMVTGYQRMVGNLKTSLAQTREAEESVRHSEQSLRRALDDRERIAQDLHDGIIQSIFALGLSLERCQRLVATDPQEVIVKLGAAVTGLKSVIRDLRGYLAGLEPHVADGLELEAALALQVRMMEASHDLHITMRVDPAAAQLVTPEQATHLLYIAREAMSNSLRHAQARHASVTLERQEGHARLVVADDGVGFERQTIQEGDGLKNMEARAAKLHAHLTVTAEPGQGTRIVFDLPAERTYV